MFAVARAAFAASGSTFRPGDVRFVQTPTRAGFGLVRGAGAGFAKPPSGWRLGTARQRRFGVEAAAWKRFVGRNRAAAAGSGCDAVCLVGDAPCQTAQR
jgi:hypothetical protein